ncbi:hypothetical protein M427DRAFT_58361 [Gonapodya prolifera JEL478]|uniref:Exoribonuclease phosphorolytic domain-containing protein n=1 Tax=Gonapodya prolifera (strain JEL478) TaxID=1344416 RepID=A0A139AAJ9_GONPJ|nr:hypothetical protein M427DRAFT_58361 [Gonapodya prolifera JEL478]|eukprot:KXS13770.1 hypothetical protein M427DRAFT_58361 [Gonapodya prolifera JEL478]
MVPAANGSAFMEAGKIKVMAAVYGPRQRPASAGSTSSSSPVLLCDFKFAPFASPSRRGYLKDSSERAASLSLLRALEPAVRYEALPERSAVDVFVTVLEEDGVQASVASAITCASVALADAGIELYDLVIGCSAAFLPSSPDTPTNVLLDPTVVESTHPSCTGSLIMAAMPSLAEVAHFELDGSVSGEEVGESIDLALDACASLHGAVKAVIAGSGSGDTVS